MVRTPDLPADDDGACRALLQALRDDIDPARVAGIYNVGSGSAGVARALAEAGLAAHAGVAAHDFTDENASLLSANALSYVLHQDIHYCVLTAARAARAVRERPRRTQRGAAAHRDPDGREPSLSGRPVRALNPNLLWRQPMKSMSKMLRA